ncbi:hypothetical protein, partial [Clostridium sp.]|uniref:hypothetical protein n=1 Tax=Clostridium sp. TaxID=1506 RepID=UPI002FDCDC1D
MRYIKATIKEVTDNHCLKVKLEGVENFILKCKDYEKEIKFVKRELEGKNNKIQEDKDKNIFISYDTNDKPFYLEDADEKFYVGEEINDLVNKIFISGDVCIFGIKGLEDIKEPKLKELFKIEDENAPRSKYIIT